MNEILQAIVNLNEKSKIYYHVNINNPDYKETL